MTESLNYVLKSIELEYLKSNSDSLRTGNFKCLQDLNLPCNCIPGVIVNFSAFLTMLFLREDDYAARLEITGNDGCIRCCKGSADLFPIKEDEKGDTSYVLTDLICQKSKEEQAYLPISPYSEIQAIQDYLDKTAEIPSKYPSESICLELSIRLLSAMRTRPLCQSSKVFLFMAAYLRPKQTLRLMFQARNEIGKEWLKQFMIAYVTFLQDIGNPDELGFIPRLNEAFRKAVDFNISPFWENLEPTGKMYKEVLISSYWTNLRDLSRKSTPIVKICKYISEPRLNKSIELLLYVTTEKSTNIFGKPEKYDFRIYSNKK